MAENTNTGITLTKEELSALLKGAAEAAVKPLHDEILEVRRQQPRLVTPEGAGIVTTGLTTPIDYKSIAFKIQDDNRKRFHRYTDGLHKDEFSFMRYFLAMIDRKWSDAPLESAILEESRKRTMTWASGSGGGYWVAVDFLPAEFIELLQANIVCRAAGARFLQATGSPVQIPKKTSGSTAYWINQGEELTPTDITAGQLPLNPHWCIARSNMSQFFAQNNAVAAEQLFREDLATSIALAVDLAILEGAGSSGEPTGLANTGSINTWELGTNGAAFSPPDIYAMDFQLNNDNVGRSGRVWIMHPRTWNAIRQFVTESGTYKYLINPNPTVGAPEQLLGYPVYQSTQVSTTNTKGNGTALANVFLVRMPEVIVAEWGTLELAATDVGGEAWIKNLIEVKATYTMDCGARHEAAVCLCNDSTS